MDHLTDANLSKLYRIAKEDGEELLMLQCVTEMQRRLQCPKTT